MSWRDITKEQLADVTKIIAILSLCSTAAIIVSLVVR